MRFHTRIDFSYRDLVSLSSWRTTLSVFVTICVVCALTVVAFGLFRGAEEVRLNRIKRTRLALRLLAGDKQNTFQQDYLDNDLKPRLHSALVEDAPFVSPFRFQELRVQKLDKSDKYTGLRGRTLRLESGQTIMDHPLLSHVSLKQPNAPANDNQGLILCPQIRNSIGLKSDDPTPDYLTVDGRDKPVKVLGELTKDLPEIVDFLMTEEVEVELLYASSVEQQKSVRSGIVNITWLEQGQKQFYEFVESNLGEEFDFQLQPVTNSEGRCLEVFFTSASLETPPPDLKKWKEILANLRVALDREFSTTTKSEFEEMQGATAQVVANRPTNYHFLELYFASPKTLPKAADLLEQEPVFADRRVNRGQADQVAGVQSYSEAQGEVLEKVKWVLAALALLILWVIQVMRSEQKRTEAGMLKVLGMSRLCLGQIVLMEVLMVWLVAASCGVALGEIGGRITSYFTYHEPVERTLGFLTSTVNIKYVVLATGVISVLSVILGTRRWYFRSPADLFSE